MKSRFGIEVSRLLFDGVPGPVDPDTPDNRRWVRVAFRTTARSWRPTWGRGRRPLQATEASDVTKRAGRSWRIDANASGSPAGGCWRGDGSLVGRSRRSRVARAPAVAASEAVSGRRRRPVDAGLSAQPRVRAWERAGAPVRCHSAPSGWGRRAPRVAGGSPSSRDWRLPALGAGRRRCRPRLDLRRGSPPGR